ncbi:MAG: FG-GAP-like repeat-containing protein [Pseudomonadota bacterium]
MHARSTAALVLLFAGCIAGTDARADVGPAGDYVERIPIAVPSFRGLEPSLAFVYSSNAGRGLLGAGWALDGFSQVRRTSQGRGLAGSAGPDVFELDGVELLPCATSPADPRRAASPSCRHPAPAPLVAYTARIETHRRIAFDPTPAGGAWHVWSRSGDRAVYRPSTSGDAWVLASVENPLGQRIEYAYRKFSPGTFGVAHPDEIRYGATVVRFLWQPRPDPSTLAQGAELLTLSHRLVAVQVETEGTTARAYSLGYETHVDTGRSVLTTIREFGRGAGVAADGTVTGDSHPAPRFAYAAATASAEWRGDERAVGPLDWRPSPALDQYTYEATSLSLPLLHASFAAADVDADGRSDGVLATVREGSPDAELQLDVRLASNAWVRTVLPFAKPGAWFLGDPPFDGRHQLLRVWTGDVDGDRREDMIVVAWRNETTNDPYNRLVLLLRVALSNGDGTFSWATGAFQDTGWVTPVAWAYTSMFRNTAPNCATGDVDGNGRTDFACTLHTGVSRQSLAIAYGRGAGDFQIGTPVQVADDPGVLTNATGAPAVIAYETRPMAIADVDRDGLADVLLLEPRATDLTACAAAGDPADVRARCTIRYDIATGISDGIGFAFERTPTPWVREDQRSVAPGSLVAADVNGDGRADVIHLPGQVFGEREQTLRAIGVALRRDGGQFAFSTQTLPTSLAGVRMQYAFGDVDGDLRTDLVAAVRIPPGGGRSCSAAAFDRALLFCVRADAGGRFQLPANWLDCSEGAEVAAQWARWTELDLEGALQIADTNGDGLADVLRPTAWTRIPDREALFAVSDAVSAPSPDAEGRWAAVDVDGDRRVDLVRVSGQNGTSWAYVRRPNAGGLTADVQSLPRFGHNGDASWRWLDLNGDGRTDLLHVQCEIRAAAGGCELRLDAWLARRGASGFDAMAAAVFPGRSARDAALTWMTGDVDGDGRADLVAVDPAPGTPARLQVRAMTSRGDGRFDESVRTVDVSAIGPSSAVLANVAGWRVADVNGDGRIDLIHLTPQSGSVRVATLIAVPGKDWRAAVAVVQHPAALPTAVLRARASPLRWHVLDANGDGASDLVRQAITDTGGVWFHTLLSEGAGTWSPRAFAAPAPANLLAGTDFGGLGWLPLDVDADGDADLVRLDSSAASVAVTTARSDARGGWTLGQQAVGGSRSVAQDVERYGWTLGDLDGDGRAEFLRARGSGGTLRLSRIGGSEISDRLVRTSLAGADARITYGDPGPAVVADTTAECALPVGVAPRVVRTVDSRAESTAAFETARFGMSCPRWSQPLRAFLGWREVTTSRDAASNRPAYVAAERYVHDDACGSRVADSARRDAAGNFVGLRQIVAYADPGPAPPYVCRPVQVRDLRYASSAARGAAQNAVREFRYDDFGNVVADVESGAATTGDERFTSRWYRPATDPWIVDALAGYQVHDGADASAPLLRARLHCYDGDATIACSQLPTRGQLTSTVDLYERGSRVTRFAYDVAGNVASVIDANQRGVAIFYDPVQRRFPTAIVGPDGRQWLTIEWDRVLGLETARVDENGVRTEGRYDALGRQAELRLPGGAVITRRYENWDGAGGARAMLESIADGSADGLWRRETYDGLGRVQRVEKQGHAAGQVLVQRMEYADTSERPARVSHWFRRGSTATRYRTFRFDEAGFLASIVEPDGRGESWAFDVDGALGRMVATDRLGRERDTWTDGLGRVVRIRDRVAGRDVVTAFTFDARDQLRRVVDPGGNVTTYSYDRLGRTLAVDDPNFGRRTFDYDPVGNLLAATDARGRTTRYAYDARGRLQAKTPPFGGPITWVYDEPGAGASRGRLTSTIDPTGNGCAGGVTERRRYDAIGRLSAMEKCVRGQTRVIGFGYNALNHVESLTYPDGEVVRYAYDAAGALESVSGWIDRVAYAADGTVERIDYANGTRLRLERDPVIGAVADERVTTANRTLYASRYEYAADGTLLTARSRTNGVDLAYTHDELGRLTAVTGTQQQSWNYDGAGNMTFNSALGKYAYPAQGPTACGGAPCAQPQGVRSAGPLSLTYDANGLVSQVVDSRSGRTRAIDWTPEGRPMLVVDFDATPTLYSYDAFGRRVVDETPTEIVRHFGHLVDESSVTGTTKYYFAGSRLIGASTGGVKRWFHADRAGAVRLVTGPGGAVLARLDHTPFGAPLSPATTASGAGAGFGLDAGPGMLLLGARAYDPTLGRFLGPDVIVPSMLETQAYNRYAFVYNAPTAWVDPSGHQAIGLEDTVRGPSGGVWMGSSWMHQPWLSAASGPPGAGMLGGAPTSLSLSRLSSWRDGYRSVGTEASVDDGADEPGIFDLMADNALELGFGGVVGGIQGLAPVGWLVPLEKVADHLDMSTGQKMWFEVGRGSALTAIGIAETVEGLSLMAAGAPPTAIGAVTVETGIGGLLLAGGATIEVAGAAVAAEGLADAGVGLSVLLRSGVYVLIDRRTVRYTGKAKKFSSRKSSHKESKPRHQFREVFKDVKDPDVRSGLEQILLELCRTCNWNRINGISPENRRYIEKMFKTFEWLEKQGIPMPKSLDEVLKRQGVLK